MEILRIENLSFTYPKNDKKALDNVSFSIEEGDFVLVCGSSGSGKTTLLRTLKPEIAPYGEKNGKILFCGEELSSLNSLKTAGEIGFVSQQPEQQIVTDTVEEELSFGLCGICTDREKIRRRVGEVVGYFGIEGMLGKKTSELSGGQKQMLCLASVMAMNPRVLILDEPTSQLDPISAVEFIFALKRLNRDMGLTVIISEHRVEELFVAADKIAVFDSGCLISFGSPYSVGEYLASSPKAERASLMLPCATKIFRGTGGVGRAPLTVRDGREYINKNFKNGVCKKVVPGAQAHEKADVAVRLDKVCFKYGRERPYVLYDCSAEINRCEIFAVLGGNGSGKTTLLSIISGLEKPISGKVDILGKNINKYKGNSLYRGVLSALPQDPQELFIGESGREEIEQVCQDKEKAEAMARTLEIDGLLDRHPYDLSGGEQQRLALCEVLLTEPKILLLDEPTRSIDAFYKKVLAEKLRALKNDGVTVIMVTHDTEFAAEVADRCAMLFGGELTQGERPEEFFSENDFYTTQAARISRGSFENAVTPEQVIGLCLKNKAMEHERQNEKK